MAKSRDMSSWELFSLAYEAEKSSVASDFKGLRSLQHLPKITFMPHQVKAAEQAIEEMNGRAILADEVGLGKTIEAGLILKEYMVRGLVKKALILVPASLVTQWVFELREKFSIPAVAYRKNYSWEQADIIVSSMDTAKRAPHCEHIANIEYDFLLIDEAHKLKNSKTKNYEFVQTIQKKYCLLLTATPIQNELIEIFNLVSILKPGHLGSSESFMKRFGNKRSALREDAYLNKLIQKVMIRNTRHETSLNTAKRIIETVWLDFCQKGKNAYSNLEEALQEMPPFARITYLRELCSSREACLLSLDQQKHHPAIRDVMPDLITIENHPKAERLAELLKSLNGEKAIVFTEYRATQTFLQWYLKRHGISSVPFRGGFKAGKKDWMRQLFRDRAQVLIATEAAGEGINLQFCHHVINYDLPWNPMKLEQRIGRVHRYGQENDVKIFNFAIRNTIEEHIMKLLYDKLELFEKVIGELDDILADLEIDSLDQEFGQIFAESTSTGEMKIKLENLMSVIESNADVQKEA
ncbi:SNF2-related protein [Aciduricibacillus chroicocephali]|uniref:SNF2-related protein n=2 Tax=Aciduricibacillus chroicocephali TaxID=3054939 RepID=A0ABY9L031_9BACI|nr:SNF2-related protein [Bacillaceae bacterium 44XB]